MSAIKKRTIYYDLTGGVIRFMDFAKVITSQGVCVEPFVSIGSRFTTSTPLQQFNWTDDMTKTLITAWVT